MRLAVVSDIHGNLGALQAVAEDIARQGVDAVLNLGDLLSGPLQPAETADWLRDRGWPTIAGNHERQLLQAYERGRSAADRATSDGWAAGCITADHARWLRGLPPALELAQGIVAVHGTPGDDLAYWLEQVTPDFGQQGSYGIRAASPQEIRSRPGAAGLLARAPALVLCGHTHVPRLAQLGGTLIVNPGSVGLQAYDDGHPHLHHVVNGTPHARYAIVEQSAGAWQARLCAVAYDWNAAAALAAARGFPDWAHALATGCMPGPAA